MEPGTSRETASGPAGGSARAGVREETPGKEARGGDGTVVMKRRGADTDIAQDVKPVAPWEEEDGEAERQMKPEDGEDAGKYEEELDPRIQA